MASIGVVELRAMFAELERLRGELPSLPKRIRRAGAIKTRERLRAKLQLNTDRIVELERKLKLSWTN